MDGEHTRADPIDPLSECADPSPMPVLGASAKLAARATPSPTPALTPGGAQPPPPPPPPPQHSPGRRDTSPPRDASGNHLNNYLFRQTFSPRKLPPDTPSSGRPSSLLQALARPRRRLRRWPRVMVGASWCTMRSAQGTVTRGNAASGTTVA